MSGRVSYRTIVPTGMLACLLLALICLSATPSRALAAPLDLGVSLGSGYTAEVDGVPLDQVGMKDASLEQVVKWRRDALDDTRVIWNGQTMRDYLATQGIPESDYLNPTWSNEAERISIQRAFECCFNWEHTRPNGDNCFTAEYPVGFSSGEVISQMWSSASGARSIGMHIDLWASEKDAYVNNTGGETGHYTFLIDPSNTEYGFAIVDGNGVGRAYRGSADSSETGLSGIYTMRFNIEQEMIAYYGVDVDQVAVKLYETKQINLFLDNEYYPFRLVSEWSTDDTSVLSITPDGQVTGIAVGKGEVTATITDSNGQSGYASFEIASGADAMHRLYNPNSGEHFYTADDAERDHLVDVGWKYEGLGWLAPETSNTPVYRLYNRFAGDHHYTTDAVERDTLVKAGWSYEGIGWHSDDNAATPLYRQYNPYATTGTHNYTTSLEENDHLVSVGWRAEGIGWYGI